MAQLAPEEHRRSSRNDANPMVDLYVYAVQVRFLLIQQRKQHTKPRTQNFNFALKFQPQAFAGLTLIAWGQTLYYHKSVPPVPDIYPMSH
jgi:hypothetical protein